MSGVYHPGELAVQQKAGATIVAEQNGKSIRSSFVGGAAAFLKTQTFLVASSADESGRVWTSYLSGKPGFIEVNDETTLTVHLAPVANDPLIGNVSANGGIGMLAIDFGRRIRMRMNGTGSFDSERRLTVAAEQVYGNCPKYIQKRRLNPGYGYDRHPKSERRSFRLSPDQQSWIRRSDTFFIGSMSPEGKLDASHRGGSPGFVKVLDEGALLFPDYYGNSMFNTLGNIYSNPSSGILFIDFEMGHSLQLTGRSHIIWDEEQAAAFPGAERLVRFDVAEALHTEVETGFSWELVEYSPANPEL